jgi:hypothetical protein
MAHTPMTNAQKNDQARQLVRPTDAATSPTAPSTEKEVKGCTPMLNLFERDIFYNCRASDFSYDCYLGNEWVASATCYVAGEEALDEAQYHRLDETPRYTPQQLSFAWNNHRDLFVALIASLSQTQLEQQARTYTAWLNECCKKSLKMPLRVDNTLAIWREMIAQAAADTPPDQPPYAMLVA